MLFKSILAAFVFVTSAHATQPTDASIEKLMEVTRVETMMDAVLGQMEGAIRQGMASAVAGKPLTAQQQQVLAQAPSRLVAAMRTEFSWPAMKSEYVRLYRETFNQSEIDGMLAFYDTPAGKAVIDKMPVVMQRSMALGQSRVQSLLPRLHAAMRDTLVEAGIRP